MSYDLDPVANETQVLLLRVEALRRAVHAIATSVDAMCPGIITGALCSGRYPDPIEELDRAFVEALAWRTTVDIETLDDDPSKALLDDPILTKGLVR